MKNQIQQTSIQHTAQTAQTACGRCPFTYIKKKKNRQTYVDFWCAQFSPSRRGLYQRIIVCQQYVFRIILHMRKWL